MNDIVIKCQDITKVFDDSNLNVEVIKNINLEIYKNQSIAIAGSSGSGKSTLLHLLGGLDNLTKGNIFWENIDISKLNEKKIGILRNGLLGFIYQFHHLLSDFTSLENVMIPLLIQKINFKEAKIRALNILDKVGLKNRVDHKPSELSGGERQRAAIARAIITNPKCILADEPTGNLDRSNAQLIFNLMLELKEEFKTSLVVVSHDLELIDDFNIKFKLIDGNLINL